MRQKAHALQLEWRRLVGGRKRANFHSFSVQGKRCEGTFPIVEEHEQRRRLMFSTCF